MKTSKTHVVLDYDGEMLTIRLNKRLVGAYRRSNMSPEPLKTILDDFRRLIESPDDRKELYVLRF